MKKTQILIILFFVLVCGCKEKSHHYIQIETKSWGVCEAVGDALSSIWNDSVVCTPDDEIIVSWTQYDNSGHLNCYINSYSSETGWGTVDLYDTGNDDLYVSELSALSANQNGDMLLVWIASVSSSNYYIYAQSFNRDTGWESSELIDQLQLDSSTHSFMGGPCIFMDNNNAIVFWIYGNYNTGNWYIYYKLFSRELGWQATHLLASGIFQEGYVQSLPNMSFNSEGKGVAVWMTQEGNSLSIWNSFFSPESGFGPPEIIHTACNEFEGPASYPSIDFDPDNNAILVWDQWDGDSQGIWSSRYTPAQGWGTAELIDTDRIGSSREPKVHINKYGLAIAMWSHLENGCWSVYSSTYTPDNGWENPILLRKAEEGTNIPVSLDFVFDIYGNAFSVWDQLVEGVNRIWASKYIFNIGWSIPELIDDPESKRSIFHQIIVDSKGNAIALWSHYDGSRETLMVNRYE